MFPLEQGIHLGKPDNCPDFIYTIMKDCWYEDPDKRLDFTGIETRLDNPFHSYEMFVATDGEEGTGAAHAAPSGNL